MRTTIELPQVGESVTEGIIGKWLVEPGQRVEKYDPLVEVVTDKVSMEAPSPYSGVFTRALVEEGQTVPMGEPICEMEVDAVADAAPPVPESVAEEPAASAPEPDAADAEDEETDESADDAVAEEAPAAAPDDDAEAEADESADDAVAEEAPAAAPDDDAEEAADEDADEAVAEEAPAAAPDDAEEASDESADDAVAEEAPAAAPDDAEEALDESADEAVAEEESAVAPDDAGDEAADDGEGRVGGAWAMPAAQDASAESAVDGESVGEDSAETEGEDAAERPEGAPSASGHPFEFVGSVRSVGPTGSGERGEGRPDAAQDASAAPREESAPPHAAAEPDRRHVVSPLVARLSAQYGIDLSTVRGTGIGGRVTSQDLLNAVSAAEEQRAAESAQATQEDAAAGGGEPAPVAESQEAPERLASVAESEEAPERPAPVAEPEEETAPPAPVAEPQEAPERPAPVAESEEAPERPAPVAETEEAPERPAPVAESAEAPEQPAPVAETEEAPERPAPVAESAEAPERPAPVAERAEEREEVAAPPPDARQDAASAAPTPDDAVSTLPVTAIRRAIADHMARSASEIPAAWAMVEADVTGLVRAREAHRGAFERESGIPLTYLPFLASAAARALRAHPRLNARWDDGRIVVNNRVNLSVAVSTESGLMVPVARDADRLSVAELAVALRRLTDAARSGTLTLDDVQGGTFTLNNTGALGSVVSVPIINHPQAAILTTEAIVKRPVVVGEDAIAARSMMNLCASFDHRVCDGADAAAFLRAVKARLEAMDESAALEQQAWAIC